MSETGTKIEDLEAKDKNLAFVVNDQVGCYRDGKFVPVVAGGKSGSRVEYYIYPEYDPDTESNKAVTKTSDGIVYDIKKAIAEFYNDNAALYVYNSSFGDFVPVLYYKDYSEGAILSGYYFKWLNGVAMWRFASYGVQFDTLEINWDTEDIYDGKGVTILRMEDRTSAFDIRYMFDFNTLSNMQSDSSVLLLYTRVNNRPAIIHPTVQKESNGFHLIWTMLMPSDGYYMCDIFMSQDGSQFNKYKIIDT